MRTAATARYEVRAMLPGTLTAVEDFVVRTRAIWRQDSEGRQVDFTSELLLREALTNAVVHGCGDDPAKLVKCFLRVRPEKMFFLVLDPGRGFNWRSEGQKQGDTSDSRGRGIRILLTYASRVRFNSFGNQVAIAREFHMRSQK